MTQQHPITPPPELVKEWSTANGTVYKDLSVFCQNIATQAARWGWNQCMKLDHAWLEVKMQEAKDQELEACLQWFSAFYCMETWMQKDLEKFRAARRPKPPSLKEQALLALSHLEKGAEPQMDATEAAYTIRRALESLPE